MVDGMISEERRRWMLHQGSFYMLLFISILGATVAFLASLDAPPGEALGLVIAGAVCVNLPITLYLADRRPAA